MLRDKESFGRSMDAGPVAGQERGQGRWTLEFGVCWSPVTACRLGLRLRDSQSGQWAKLNELRWMEFCRNPSFVRQIAIELGRNAKAVCVSCLGDGGCWDLDVSEIVLKSECRGAQGRGGEECGSEVESGVRRNQMQEQCASTASAVTQQTAGAGAGDWSRFALAIRPSPARDLRGLHGKVLRTSGDRQDKQDAPTGGRGAPEGALQAVRIHAIVWEIHWLQA